MSVMTPFVARPSRTRRQAEALGAVASSAITLGALLVLFHHAAPAHWRTDAAVLQAASDVCRKAGAADGRLRCMDALLARHASGEVHLAQAAAP